LSRVASSWKCEQLDSISIQVQNVNLKLNLMISLASLNSCICDLKCMHFVCWIILFLWSLCFRYSFYTSNVLCVFHIIHSHLDFIITSKQLWFQKSFAQFDDFVKKINFLMIFCNTLIILHTLSFIIVLLFKEHFKDKCICR